jgi:uncharacterized protein YqcC (DUF446 family)
MSVHIIEYDVVSNLYGTHNAYYSLECMRPQEWLQWCILIVARVMMPQRMVN